MLRTENGTKKLFAPADERVVRARDLKSYTGLSPTTCWRLGKDKKSNFPAKIKLSAGAVGYLLSELLAWLDSKKS